MLIKAMRLITSNIRYCYLTLQQSGRWILKSYKFKQPIYINYVLMHIEASERLLFSTIWGISQPYHGENKLSLDEMMTMYALY